MKLTSGASPSVWLSIVAVSILLCHLWKGITKVVTWARIENYPIKVVKQPANQSRLRQWLFPIGGDEKYLIELDAGSWNARTYSPPWTTRPNDKVSIWLAYRSKTAVELTVDFGKGREVFVRIEVDESEGMWWRAIESGKSE